MSYTRESFDNVATAPFRCPARVACPGRPKHYRTAVHPYAWTWNEETLVLVPALGGRVRDLGAPGSGPSAGASRASRSPALLILAFGVSPLHEIALRYLLWIHLLQNVVLAEWAPFLLVVSLPASAGRGAGRAAVAGAR